MTASQIFLVKELKTIFNLFDNSSIRYEYVDYSRSHLIEIMPFSLYSSDEYIEFESSISDKFYQMFPNDSLVFISENSLTKIQNPTICLSRNELELPIYEVIYRNYRSSFWEFTQKYHKKLPSESCINFSTMSNINDFLSEYSIKFPKQSSFLLARIPQKKRVQFYGGGLGIDIIASKTPNQRPIVPTQMLENQLNILTPMITPEAA